MKRANTAVVWAGTWPLLSTSTPSRASSPQMSYLWIGGTKDIVEDQWRWVTGEALRPGDWCRGSPEITVGARDCIYMELDCHPPLRSGSCLGSRKYICQYRP
ncbi:putative Lectin C-type domain-containing protein 6 [Homarus americanus]|uniref:Putative Lectin C-type domain-containing protein 6 n=1 Tax=Homarus americanus TaxID=6706 RepID=A0A8J5N7M4_HOMAM|nr:putative Lectin C-type domain-containing protein 6 [Homarus americanus]